MKEFSHVVVQDVECNVDVAVEAVRKSVEYAAELRRALDSYGLQNVTSAAHCSCSIISLGAEEVLLEMTIAFVLDEDRFFYVAAEVFADFIAQQTR